MARGRTRWQVQVVSSLSAHLTIFCQQFEHAKFDRAQFERAFDNNISGQEECSFIASGMKTVIKTPETKKFKKTFLFGGIVNIILQRFQKFNQEGMSTFVWTRMAHSVVRPRSKQP